MAVGVISMETVVADAESILVGVGVLLYGLASVLCVVRLMQPRRFGGQCVVLLLTAGAIPLAAVLIAHGLRTGRLPVFGRFEALTVYGLTVTAAYALSALRHRIKALAAVLVPYVTTVLLIGMPAVRDEVSIPFRIDTVWMGLHVLTAFAGYALCTLAGMLGLAYLIQDNNLKHKRFGVVFERFPALETLDHLMSRQIGAAFLMLTVSLALGVHLVHLSGGGVEWARDPKVMATVATWGIYAVLMHMRTNADRHGKGMAIITIAGLFFVLFSFLGIHVIAESLHGFVLIGTTSW